MVERNNNKQQQSDVSVGGDGDDYQKAVTVVKLAQENGDVGKHDEVADEDSQHV